jgi:mitogen-activated protein kinase kinase kinase
MEFCPGGSVSKALNVFGAFPECIIQNYTRQILQGLKFLHDNKIIHRCRLFFCAHVFPQSSCFVFAAVGGVDCSVLHVTRGVRDIKGGNIFIAPNGVIKIGDLGASVMLTRADASIPGDAPLQGSPFWMAPEVVLQV